MVVLQFGLVDVNEGLKAALAGDAQTVTRRMAEGEEHFDVALELLSGTTDLSTAIAARTQRGAARCWMGDFAGGLGDFEEASVEALEVVPPARSAGAAGTGLSPDRRRNETDGLALLRPAFRRPRNWAISGARPTCTNACRRCTKRAGTFGGHCSITSASSRSVRVDGKLSTQRARLHEARAELLKLHTQTAALHARTRTWKIAFAS
jgi:hypothetical protein